jgi:NAD(P)H-hydrate epimerase
MKVVTAEQIREVDRLTVDLTGIPWATLMETAGARIAEIILEESESDRNVIAVFCGKGNNGGDGAVIARHLCIRGATVDVFLIGRLEESRDEARANLEIIKRLAEANATSGGGELTFIEVPNEDAADIHIFHDTVVDALLGTGLTRPAEGLYAKAIESINRARSILPEVVHVVSVDIPSGIFSDSSQTSGPFVRADLTVTFTAPKAGNVLPPASDANGKLIIASIGTTIVHPTSPGMPWITRDVKSINLLSNHGPVTINVTSVVNKRGRKLSVCSLICVAA